MEITTRTVEAAGDGGPMPIYVAEPASGGGHPVVIVFMEAFGVNPHIVDVTNRFAQEGYVAVSPDMYYRNGPGIVVGYEEIPKIMPLMTGMNDVQSNADFRVVIDFIKTLEKADASRIATTGYCMGGTLSWLCACLNRDVKAAAVYYGGGLITRETHSRRPLSPHGYSELLTAPVLGCFGELDKNPPPEDVNEVDALLTEMGKEHDFHIYVGANHGFFCDDRPSYHKEAAEDAWERTLAWFSKHLG